MTSQVETSLNMKWNLKTIYASEKEFDSDVGHAKDWLQGFYSQLETSLKEAIFSLQKADALIKDFRSYVSCLLAEHPQSVPAQEKNGIVTELESSYNKALFILGFTLGKQSDEKMKELCKEAKIGEISHFIYELRALAKIKGSREKEEFLESLLGDGYHAFWNLYQIISSKLRIGEKGLSVGQTENLLTHADRHVRLKTFEDLQGAWKEQSTLVGQIINHIAGMRWKVYEERKWKDVLQEPLFLNRMQPQTLQAMWGEVEKIKPALCQYLQHKAKILGLKKLSWVDIEAPLATTDHISYEDGGKKIVEQFNAFHPRMGDFAKKALSSGWIEAEDRTGKASGGFCVFLRKKKQSRIFMTFKGSSYNVLTLAHELGHAYHNLCIEHLPSFNQEISMNVAETASTFAELILVNASIEQAKNKTEKLLFLDEKLQRCVAYCMNLHARFVFETRFYQERKKGFVSPEKLCALMETAQKETYKDSLSDWHPYFWAAKAHFYYTDYPFYNFPYTFGFLMSSGLYQLFSTTPGFGSKFDAFLEDTGRMNVEDLAKKHLNMDLTKPDFWKLALQDIQKNVEEFLSYPA